MNLSLEILTTNPNSLSQLLETYENDLLGYEKNLTMSGKTLEFCLKEQATWTAYYSERKSEIKTIVAHVENQIKSIRARLYVQYNEMYNPALGDRAIEKYIDREEEYITAYRSLLECQEILSKYDMLLDAFNRRGFALRDITSLRIASLNESVL